jgi:hypothetical protein
MSEEPDKFNMVTGLMVNLEVGEGEVDLPDWFKNETPILGVGVLQDWITSLQNEYIAALKDL